jgi:DNA primase small subunit
LDKIGKELGINIDPQVTMDIHRIFRMPGTLSSKSGLAKMKCSDLKSFNPLNEACLVGGELIKIRANAPVKFTLKEQEFHVEKKITFLPAYAAIYLVCKRLAIVV